MRTEPKSLVRDRHNILARLVMRIGHDVSDVVDGPGHHIRAIEQPHHLWKIAFLEPFGDQGVELVRVSAARDIVRVARVIRKFRPSHRFDEALERALRTRRDADPAPVARLVGVARRVLSEPVPLPRLDDPELIEADDLGLDQPEQRLIEAHVDHLPASVAALIALIDGEHRRHRGEGRRRRSGEWKPGQRGRPVREAGERRRAAEALGHSAVAAAMAVGAGLAEA